MWCVRRDICRWQGTLGLLELRLERLSAFLPHRSGTSVADDVGLELAHEVDQLRQGWRHTDGRATVVRSTIAHA